jgi:uncharacterized protein YndB with AHSA1/START domain
MKNDHSERQIITTRVFNAPRKIVFSAWTNPDLLTQWWGPKGFTSTFHQFELKQGGVWKYTQHGPNGGNYENESVFVKIEEPERIIIDHVSPPHFLLTASFEEVDENKTRLVFEQAFDTVEEYNKIKVFAVDANEENMDRLEEALKQFTKDIELTT